MPLGDWQFWVVTIAAIACAAWLIRMLRPKKNRSVKTTLTVSAKKHD